MIIVDTNHVLIASAAVATKEYGKDAKLDDVRNLFFGTIKDIRSKFVREFGSEMVFAFDSDTYWRKEFYPYYKALRKDTRADSPLDWDFVHMCIESIKQELDLLTPYKVVCVPGAEGDDVIASIVIHRHKPKKEDTDEDSGLANPFASKVLKTMIVSSDHDFCQLQLFDGVRQYSTTMNKDIIDHDPQVALIEKVIRGDRGDSIPSSISPDDVFVTKVRQKPIKATSVEEWIPAIRSGNIPEELTYFERNYKLISLYSIPKEVQESCVTTYVNAKTSPRSEMMYYFTSHKLGQFIKDLQDF